MTGQRTVFTVNIEDNKQFLLRLHTHNHLISEPYQTVYV